MPVSGIGSAGANYPVQPPINGVSAYGFVMLGRLSNIAGALSATSGVSAVSAVGNSQDVMNAELQALADLAEIHTYLASGDTQDAINAANDFLSLNSKYNFTDPNITALYTQASSYFQINGSGQVTGFIADSSNEQFGDWWGSGTAVSNNTPGIVTAFAALGLLKNDISFGPSTQYPSVLVNICVLYADALTTSYGKTQGQLDTSFWGTDFGTLFPYAMATYAYATCNNNGTEDWTQFNAMMSKMGTFLKDVTPADGVTFVNFPAMVSEYSDLQSKMAQNPSWPPPQAAGIPPDTYNRFLYYANQGLSTLYGVLFDDMYTAWRGH